MFVVPNLVSKLNLCMLNHIELQWLNDSGEVKMT